MSGGTPGQYTAMISVICLIVAGLVTWVVVGRVRRARATGATEAGSVRSSAQATEIADRLHTYGAEQPPGDDARPAVRVRGAARLLARLRDDDRFDVTPRDHGGDYWSFVVLAPGDGPADGDALARGLADILDRNGVTALAPADQG